MDIKEAQAIIKVYEKILVEEPVGGSALRKESSLPHSKAKIKHAYFVFLEHTYLNEASPQLNPQKIAEAYGELGNFVDDNTAIRYGKIYEDWQRKKSSFTRDKKDERLIKQYVSYVNFIKLLNLKKEIEDYIVELTKGD